MPRNRAPNSDSQLTLPSSYLDLDGVKAWSKSGLPGDWIIFRFLESFCSTYKQTPCSSVKARETIRDAQAFPYGLDDTNELFPLRLKEEFAKDRSPAQIHVRSIAYLEVGCSDANCSCEPNPLLNNKSPFRNIVITAS